ncbi:MAG: hydroxymethylpyrimidine/phosphomethylpyrimidine kinase [Gammaproteobacteria bacterium]
MPNVNPTVLVIGGSDSSGGAGIARDLQALHAMNVRGVAVVTAVTAQTNTSVRSINLVPHGAIRDQIETALSSNRIHAIKIGMLGTKRAVETVALSLPLRSEVPVVLDPVLATSSGSALADDDARIALVELLFPRATIVTPNAVEAASLLGEPVATDAATLEAYALRLLDDGSRAVLLKGGHAEGEESVDILVSADRRVARLSGPRRRGTLRGTGCALASAIAAGLARELSLLDACREGKRYVMELFEQSLAS